MKKILHYTAYVQRMAMRQEGEKYMTEWDRADWDDFADFDTHEEAVDWLMQQRDQMVATDGGYTIHKTRRGLDSITYYDLGIMTMVQRDDMDEPDFDDDMEIVCCTLPEKVEEAARKAERSYWRYLDYEEPEYYGIAAFLD